MQVVKCVFLKHTWNENMLSVTIKTISNWQYSNKNNEENNRVIDDVLSIKVATRNAGKGIFMLSSYLESIGKHVTKNKVSDSEE